MPKRNPESPEPADPPGDRKDEDWDFMTLLNKDIRDLGISDSLRRLGSIKVTDWDFRDVLPAVNRLAHQEVDLMDLARRTASYKVMEWDFRSALSTDSKPAPETPPDAAEARALVGRMEGLLRYLVDGLTEEPSHARIKVREIAPQVLRFTVILVNSDVPMLVGRGGHTAAAIRNLLQAEAKRIGMHALLRIHSHEVEMTLVSAGED